MLKADQNYEKGASDIVERQRLVWLARKLRFNIACQ